MVINLNWREDIFYVSTHKYHIWDPNFKQIEYRNRAATSSYISLCHSSSEVFSASKEIWFLITLLFPVYNGRDLFNTRTMMSAAFCFPPAFISLQNWQSVTLCPTNRTAWKLIGILCFQIFVFSRPPCLKKPDRVSSLAHYGIIIAYSTARAWE